MFMDEVVFAGVAIVGMCVVFFGGLIYWGMKQNAKPTDDSSAQ